jgi:hypothetical protein
VEAAMSSLFLVWCSDLGETLEDAHEIKAYDAESAAQAYAEQSYHDEPYDSEIFLTVKPLPGSDITRWVVLPDPSINFLSRKLSS